MDRSYVTVHVGADTRAQIVERTESGESVEDWVRDAIHRRLGDDGEEEVDENGDDTTTRRDEPNYEFVDDCGL